MLDRVSNNKMMKKKSSLKQSTSHHDFSGHLSGKMLMKKFNSLKGHMKDIKTLQGGLEVSVRTAQKQSDRLDRAVDAMNT